MEIGFVNNIENNYFKDKKVIGFVGEISDLKVILNPIEFINFQNIKHVKKLIKKNDLKILDLNHEIMNKKVSELSSTELKLILFMKAILLKPKLIILNNFDIGLTDQTLKKIIIFIKTITENKSIHFIIISNNILFINEISSGILIMKNKVIKYQGDLISAIKQGMLEKPEIINFIDLANKKRGNIPYNLDGKELLKAIYRSVF